MIKAVVFDIDDTLIPELDFIHSGYRHIAKLLEKYTSFGSKYTYDLLIKLFNEEPTYVFNRALDNLKIEYDEDRILFLVQEHRKHLPNLAVYEDVVPTLNDLKSKNIKLGIISDGHAKSQRNKLTAVTISSYFDKIILTDEWGKEFWKPNTKAFELMKNALKVEFCEMVYVGDNLNKDFVATNKLGMLSVYIRREKGIYNKLDKNNFTQEFYADLEIEKLTQLNEILAYVNGEEVEKK